MRFLIGLFLLLISSGYLFASQTDVLLGNIGALQFAKDLQKINNYKSIEDARPTEVKLRKYIKVWSFLNYVYIKSYTRDLKSKINFGFKEQDIHLLNDFFSKPFNQKMIKLLSTEANTYDLFNQIKIEGYLSFPPSDLTPSLQDLYNAIGGASIHNFCLKIMEGDVANLDQIIVYNPLSHEKLYFSTNLMEKRKAKVKDFILMNYHKNLISVKKSEIDYFTKEINKNETIKSFVQFIYQYNYFYFLKLYDSKSKQLRDEDQ